MGTIVLANLQTDRKLVEQHLDKLLGSPAGAGGTVLDAMRYAVLGSGQRLRPLLCFRVARMLRAEAEETVRAAAAVELLHCASLIVDDLPCMDNSMMRRDRPCAHLVYGESTALLGAFALVALAARTLVEGGQAGWRMERLVRFQRKLLLTMDCSSLIGGQALDLQLTGTNRDRERHAISDLKTVPLFQLAVHGGAIFAEGNADLTHSLNCLGREFGLAYQMTDDFLDGEESDLDALRKQFERTRQCVSQFGEQAGPLDDLLSYLDGKAFSHVR